MHTLGGGINKNIPSSVETFKITVVLVFVAIVEIGFHTWMPISCRYHYNGTYVISRIHNDFCPIHILVHVRTYIEISCMYICTGQKGHLCKDMSHCLLSTLYNCCYYLVGLDT